MRDRLTLERAVAIATTAHAGQVDKAAVPYIEHPLAVMRRVEGDDEKIVAVLHDVLEDTAVTVEDLRAAGATEQQLTALVSVTRREDEAYEDAIRRALADPIGRAVKIADHEHNTDPARLAALPEDVAQRLLCKYEAIKYLIDAARVEPHRA